MGRFLDARFVAGAIGGIVVAFVGTLLFGLGRPEKKDIDVYLTMTGRECRAVNPLSLQSKHKKKLTWHIHNQCNTTQYVQLRNFAERTPTGPGAPESGVFLGDN